METPTVISFQGNNTAPCAKVSKLREFVNGREVWCDWCYVHHHWLNGEHGVTLTPLSPYVRRADGEERCRNCGCVSGTGHHPTCIES